MASSAGSFPAKQTEPSPVDTRATGDQRPHAQSLPALTGLRIFAALAVYAHHVGAPSGSPAAVQAFFASGYSGVTLFFVLSGFVLALNYAASFQRPSLVGAYNYGVARFARIYPLYLLLLLYFTIVQPHAGASGNGLWIHLFAVQAWVPDLTLAFGFNPPAWSISVEIFLYACFPLLVPLIVRLARRPRSLLLAGAVVLATMVALAAWFAFTASVPWADPNSAHRWLYRTPLTRLGDFTLGILAALLYLATRGRPSLERIGYRLRWGQPLRWCA